MFYSIPKYVEMTVTLSEFLVLIAEHYFPPLKEKLQQGIQNSLERILELSVVKSFLPITKCELIESDLLDLIKPMYEQAEISFMKKSGRVFDQIVQYPIVGETKLEGSNDDVCTKISSITSNEAFENSSIFTSDKVQFPSKLEQVLDSSLYDEDGVKKYLTELLGDAMSNMLSNPSIDNLNLVLNLFLEKIHAMKEEDKNEAIKQTAFFVAKELTPLQGETNISRFCDKNNFESILFEKTLSNSSQVFALEIIHFCFSLDASIGFRFLIFLISKDNSQSAYLCSQSNQSSNSVVLFRKNSEKAETLLDPFKNLIRKISSSQEMSERSILAEMLKSCANVDLDTFLSVVPFVFSQLAKLSVGNTQLLHQIVSFIYPSKLFELSNQLVLGNFDMFGGHQTEVLEQSLSWESFEQVCIWQLLRSELSSFSRISKQQCCQRILTNLLPKLDYTVHHEVMSSLTVILNDILPCSSILKPLLSTNEYFVEFVACVLVQMEAKDSILLSSVLSTLLEEIISTSKQLVCTSLTHLNFFCAISSNKKAMRVDIPSCFDRKNKDLLKKLKEATDLISEDERKFPNLISLVNFSEELSSPTNKIENLEDIFSVNTK